MPASVIPSPTIPTVVGDFLLLSVESNEGRRPAAFASVHRLSAAAACVRRPDCWGAISQLSPTPQSSVACRAVLFPTNNRTAHSSSYVRRHDDDSTAIRDEWPVVFHTTDDSTDDWTSIRHSAVTCRQTIPETHDFGFCKSKSAVVPPLVNLNNVEWSAESTLLTV